MLIIYEPDTILDGVLGNHTVFRSITERYLEIGTILIKIGKIIHVIPKRMKLKVYIFFNSINEGKFSVSRCAGKSEAW